MVIKDSVWYAPAAEPRTLHIYLPDQYDVSGDRYPVMYLRDGHNLFYDSHATYGKSWGLREFLDGWTKDMIIVGLECSHEGNHRLDEYCPYNTKLMGINIQGEGDKTLDWITQSLKPYIDSCFRTWPSREATAIGGSSMGGLMSLYAVTKYNSVFSKAACVSSSIFMVMQPLMDDIFHSQIDPDTRVYLSWGEKEGGTDPKSGYCSFLTNSNRKVDNLLRKKGAATRLYCQPDGVHSEACWEKEIPDFMDFLWMSE